MIVDSRAKVALWEVINDRKQKLPFVLHSLALKPVLVKDRNELIPIASNLINSLHHTLAMRDIQQY